MAFDPKCYELAIAFLGDEPQLQKQTPELAQAIQDAIEEWIQWENLPECEMCDEGKATHEIDGQDITPTDRGDWVQSYKAKVCMKCYGKNEVAF